MTRKIEVVRPSLPNLEKFVTYLEEIWKNEWITNMGPFHNELEKNLTKYLGVENLSLVNNCTNGLMIGLKSFGFEGEVITTPFSFIATSHSILWNNLKPIFVDIEKTSFNISPKLIEAKLTKNTVAILATHCFGAACEVEEIDKIAKRHGLKVLYDAAHAFGVKYNGRSLLEYGDMSFLSFHATKLYNTIEGGAIVTSDNDLYNKVKSLRNFGIVNDNLVDGLGLNAKMNELCAAYGLVELERFEEVLEARTRIYDFYSESFVQYEDVGIQRIPEQQTKNCSYFPIVLKSKLKGKRDKLLKYLISLGVNARRYFYPLITNSELFSVDKNSEFPVAHYISENILCLPLYDKLKMEDAKKVVVAIDDFVNKEAL